jgi:YVTN family beta-propeller protein
MPKKWRWAIVAVLIVLAVVGVRFLRGKRSSERLYVSSEGSGTVTVIDVATRSIVGRIAVGKRPRGVQVSPDGRVVYVALSGSPAAGPDKKDGGEEEQADKSADGIGVIDATGNTLVRTLTAGSDPEQLAIGPDGRTLYVANEDAAELSAVDIERNVVKGVVPVGKEPEGVAVGPDGKTVWVTSEAEGRVYMIDASAMTKLATIDVGARPRAIAISNNGARALVTLENAGAVAVVNVAARAVERTVKIEGENARPMGVVLSPDGEVAYVTTGRGKRVVAIAAGSGQQAWSVEVGDRPWGIAISSDGTLLFTANGPSNDVSVIDVRQRSVVARIDVGGRPWGAALRP